MVYPEKRTLVLIDGWSFGDSTDLGRVVNKFNDQCVQGAVAAVAQIQSQLTAGPVHWLGSAWGGHVGLQLAATRPELVRSLVTVSTPVHAPTPPLRRQVAMLVPIYRAIGMRGPVRQGGTSRGCSPISPGAPTRKPSTRSLPPCPGTAGRPLPRPCIPPFSTGKT